MSIKTSEFIEKAKKVHGDRYNYDSVDYINNHTKITLFCERHGAFIQAPKNHLNGNGCPKCSHAMTNEEFITRVNEVHNNKYSYVNTIYNKASEKIEIDCSIHGSFIQKAQSHLQGVGCPKCANESRSSKLRFTTEEFIEKAKEIHGDKYDYSKVDFKGSRVKVKIFCNTHGQFLQTPNGHLNGYGCIKCGKIDMAEKTTKTTEQFISEANLVHNGEYLYNHSKYIKGTEKIDILCTTHGLFKQAPNNHIQGQGCPKCRDYKNVGGFGKSDFIRRAKGRMCTFYTLRCFNEDEEFYKIGITSVTVQERYPSVRSMPYSYEVISEIKGSADFIWDLETEEKRKLKEFKYVCKIHFEGAKTECFTKYEL